MITGIGAATGTPSAGTGSGLGALDGEACLKLMEAQLRYQNPLEPTDSSQMMAQSAAFTQVETLQKLASAQQTMLGMSEALMATNLVGQQVSAVRPDDSVMQGVVDGVRFTADGPLLSVSGEEVALAAVVQIGTTSGAAAPDVAADTTPDTGAPAEQPSSPDPSTSDPSTGYGA